MDAAEPPATPTAPVSETAAYKHQWYELHKAQCVEKSLNSKRARLGYVSEEELPELRADQRKKPNVCRECRLVCKMITAAHLRTHDLSGDSYRAKWGFSKGTALVSETTAEAFRKAARENGNLRPDAGLAFLRSPQKGRKMSEEFKRKTADRMRGTRNLERDTEVLRLWLLESLPIEEIAQRVGLKSQGNVHLILRRIFGFRVKQRVVFSRGAAVTNRWLKDLRSRYGVNLLDVGRWLKAKPAVIHYWEQLLAPGGRSQRTERALSPETAGPLLSGEGLFLEIILAGADASADDRADYLRAVVPDLAEKSDGAVRAIKIARAPEELKEVCLAAQQGNREARTALAFLPAIAAWLPILPPDKRAAPSSELARLFLPGQFRTTMHVMRDALARTGPTETRLPTIRAMLRSAFHVKELQAQLAARSAPSQQKDRGGKKRGYMADDTRNLILLAAALERLGNTKTYTMAPRLYPITSRRTREASESATRLLRRRHRQEITEARGRLDAPKATEILATIHPAGQPTPNR